MSKFRFVAFLHSPLFFGPLLRPRQSEEGRHWEGGRVENDTKRTVNGQGRPPSIQERERTREEGFFSHGRFSSFFFFFYSIATISFVLCSSSTLPCLHFMPPSHIDPFRLGRFLSSCPHLHEPIHPSITHIPRTTLFCVYFSTFAISLLFFPFLLFLLLSFSPSLLLFFPSPILPNEHHTTPFYPRAVHLTNLCLFFSPDSHSSILHHTDPDTRSIHIPHPTSHLPLSHNYNGSSASSSLVKPCVPLSPFPFPFIPFPKGKALLSFFLLPHVVYFVYCFFFFLLFPSAQPP